MSYSNALDFETNLAKGNYPNISILNLVGVTDTLGAGAIVDVWGQSIDYPFSTSEFEWFISSDNASDNQTIRLFLLDDDYEEIGTSEDSVLKMRYIDVTLNGQTPVSIGNAFRINRAYNISSTDLAGNVYIFETDTTTGGIPDNIATKLRGIITIDNGTYEASYNTLNGAIFTVPKSKKLLVKEVITGSSSNQDLAFYILQRPEGKSFTALRLAEVTFRVSDSTKGGMVMPEKTDFKVRAKSYDAGVTLASATINAHLIRL